MSGDVMRWPVALPYSPAINNAGGSKRLALPPALAIALTCLLTVAIAHALHLAIERPVVRRVRDALAARGLA